MKKILVIASKYSVGLGNNYLTNDLVNEFLRRNINVTVIALGPADYFKKSGVLNEYVIGLMSSVKYWKYFITWVRLMFIFIKLILKREKFNQILMFAPLSVMLPAAILVRLIKCDIKTVVVFDIFPIHQIKIKAIPARFGKIFKSIEVFLLNSFNEVIAMGCKNKAYISRYYVNSTSVKNIKEINLWGSADHTKKMSPYNSGPVKLIFGGQVIKGRKIEILIEFVEILNFRGLNLTLDLFSSGAYFEYLRSTYNNLPWLNFNSTIPREKYREILAGYHVGVLVTDNSSDLPAFPSKIIDYASAGLYVLGIVEIESELFNVVSRFERVHLNSFDFSDAALINAECFINRVKNNSALLEINQLEEIFNVSSAVERILN